MAAVYGTSHASADSTPLRCIFKKPKSLFTPTESHASAVSLLDNGEQNLYKSDRSSSKTT